MRARSYYLFIVHRETEHLYSRYLLCILYYYTLRPVGVQYKGSKVTCLNPKRHIFRNGFSDFCYLIEKEI